MAMALVEEKELKGSEHGPNVFSSLADIIWPQTGEVINIIIPDG